MTANLFHTEQRSLGRLVAELRECNPEDRVAFAFCGRAPNGMHPCTPVGHLALGHAALHEGQRPTVKRLMDALYGAIHQVFKCRDGNEFRATDHTPLWVADEGETATTVIVGVYRREHGVYIRTDHWEIA